MGFKTAVQKAAFKHEQVFFPSHLQLNKCDFRLLRLSLSLSPSLSTSSSSPPLFPLVLFTCKSQSCTRYAGGLCPPLLHQDACPRLLQHPGLEKNCWPHKQTGQLFTIQKDSGGGVQSGPSPAIWHPGTSNPPPIMSLLYVCANLRKLRRKMSLSTPQLHFQVMLKQNRWKVTKKSLLGPSKVSINSASSSWRDNTAAVMLNFPIIMKDVHHLCPVSLEGAHLKTHWQNILRFICILSMLTQTK